MIVYTDCHHAIRDANATGLRGVGYKMPEKGWVIYNPIEGCPENVQPEFFCIRSGRLPIPLNDEAMTIFQQMLTKGA